MGQNLPDSRKDRKVLEMDEGFRRRVTGHRERLRRKFQEYGLQAFSDEEALEFLLTISTPRRDVKPAAREALKRFGHLAAVFEAEIKELVQIPGIGPKNALIIKFVYELTGRFLNRRLVNRPYLSSSKEVYEYLAHQLFPKEKEVFWVIYLDARHRILTVEELSRGTVDQSVVYPREVMEAALRHRASAMVLVHNHPSGDPHPSGADLALTKRLWLAACLLDLRLLDHLIVAKGGYFSFADEGLMAQIESEVRRL